eukprot:SAG31_NODE_16811_length_695_cov_0.565436_2_plen_36_part_01
MPARGLTQHLDQRVHAEAVAAFATLRTSSEWQAGIG